MRLDLGNIQASVVRIYATTQDPDYDSPWQAAVPYSSTGSGVVVADNKILTGAHVVANGTFIQVQKVAEPEKRVAQVISICHDCDLALLEVADPDFMNDIEIATIGDLPHLRDRVAVLGFPVGGQEVSVTEGVVSRIEVQRFSHSQRYLLAVTVDAAINSGNSGGPVFKDGQVVGIAFQKLGDAEGIGELVPTPIIKHFLAAADKGHRRLRIPGLGITTQEIENPFLRTRLGLERRGGGVLVLSVEHDGSAWGAVQPGDVLLELDAARIASNATIQLFGQYRTRYDAMLGWRSTGDVVPLKVNRNGQILTVEIKLKPMTYLVPRDQYDVAPTYYIFGGLVFQPLSRNLLETWENWWDKAPKELLHLYYSGTRTAQQHEVVVLTQVLAEETNVGYDGLESECVASVNGKKPLDMIDFARMLDAANGMVEIRTTADSFIAFDAAAARAANTTILKRYHIPADRSPDLRPQQ